MWAQVPPATTTVLAHLPGKGPVAQAYAIGAMDFAAGWGQGAGEAYVAAGLCDGWCGFIADHVFAILETGELTGIGSLVNDLSYKDLPYLLGEATKTDMLLLVTPTLEDMGPFLTNNLGKGDHAMLSFEYRPRKGPPSSHGVNVFNVDGELRVYDGGYAPTRTFSLQEYLKDGVPGKYTPVEGQASLSFAVRPERTYTFPQGSQLLLEGENEPGKVTYTHTPDVGGQAVESAELQQLSQDATEYWQRYCDTHPQPRL